MNGKITFSIGTSNEAKIRGVKMSVEKLFPDAILEYKYGNVM